MRSTQSEPYETLDTVPNPRQRVHIGAVSVSKQAYSGAGHYTVCSKYIILEKGDPVGNYFTYTRSFQMQ